MIKKKLTKTWVNVTNESKGSWETVGGLKSACDSLSTILEEIFAREEGKKKARETSLDAKFQDYKNLGYPPAQPLSKSVGC